MNESMILPILVFYPFAGAVLAGIAGRNRETLRDYLADFIAVSEFILMLVLFFNNAGNAGQGGAASLYRCYLPGICGMGLHFMMDGFRMLYGLIAAFMWMMTTILSGEYMRHHENRNRYYLFLLATLGATMGVFLSEDLFTMFIFFEIMSFTSYVWVAQEETENALKAAATYLAVAIIGGLVMLMGIFVLYYELDTLNIAELLPAAQAYCGNRAILYGAGACLLVGFGAKAGAFPLHIWLPKAHPVAPAPASALLSGILTKTGIFGILAVSCHLFLSDRNWGSLLLCIGVLTMFGGALLAVFSIDLKRTLACSSMSQIGFILIGAGMQGLLEENITAMHGTLLHMVNHSLIKLVLFMAAGVVFMNAHALNLNEIRGFGRKKPLLKIIFLIGALAISGIPFFGGYISKTLLHESILEYGGGIMMKTVEIIFLISGGLTAAYMTKLFIAVFVEKNNDAEKQAQYDEKRAYMNPGSTFALSVSAFILLVLGLFPHTLMDRAARLGESFMNPLLVGNGGETVAYFGFSNLKGALISIAIGVLVYFFIVRKALMREGNYVDKWPKWLDMEHLLYRPLLLGFLPVMCGIASRVLDSAVDIAVVVLRKTLYRDSPLPYERKEGDAVTEFIGKTMNVLQSVRNRLWGRKRQTHKDFVYLTAARVEDFRESFMIIQRSLSFGLLMFGIGLALTLIYILWW